MLHWRRPVLVLVGHIDADTMARVYWLREQVLRGGSGVKLLGRNLLIHCVTSLDMHCTRMRVESRDVDRVCRGYATTTPLRLGNKGLLKSGRGYK